MNNIQEIGSRIKQERLNQGMTLKQVSDATGFSIGYLSQFERGLSPIAIDSLHKITDVLGIRFLDLFQDEEEYADSPDKTYAHAGTPVTRSYEAKCDKISEQIIQFTLSRHPKGHSYLPRIYHLMPHIGEEELPELYGHEGVEFIYVLEGVLKLFYDAQEYILYAGDSVQLDSTKTHNWTNCSSQITKILTVNIPNPLLNN